MLLFESSVLMELNQQKASESWAKRDEKKAGDFQPEKFKDTYTLALRELIKAKQEKRAPREIEEAPPVSNVINLMDALKRSVGKGGETRAGGKAKEPARKTKSEKSKSAKSAKKARRRKAA